MYEHGDGLMFIGVVVLIVFFWGEPDLHDVLISYLQGKCK